jgi:hypothetical protein
MPDKPPHDDEADFLDFLSEEESEEGGDKPEKPPKGEEGDLVVLQHGSEPGESSDQFREGESPEAEEAPGEDFLEKPPEKQEEPSEEDSGEDFLEKPPEQQEEPSGENSSQGEEGEGDELLGWLDGAAKDSLEEEPDQEDMPTQDMESAEDLLQDETKDIAAVDEEIQPEEVHEEAFEAEVEAEAEAEADLIFGEESKAIPSDEPAGEPAAVAEEEESKLDKQGYDEFREMATEDKQPEAEEAVEEEAVAEFDAFLSDDGAAAASADRPARRAAGESRFALDDGTPVPALPASLGGYSPPTEPEFGGHALNYPEIRTPAPVLLIILLLILAGAVGAGYFYRDRVKKYAINTYNTYFASTGSGEVPTTGTETGTGTETITSTSTGTVPETKTGTSTAQPDTSPYTHEVWLSGRKYEFMRDYKGIVKDFISEIKAIQNLGTGGTR